MKGFFCFFAIYLDVLILQWQKGIFTCLELSVSYHNSQNSYLPAFVLPFICQCLRYDMVPFERYLMFCALLAHDKELL